MEERYELSVERIEEINKEIFNNEELEASGYIVVSGKIPRAFWEKKFFGYQNAVQTA